MSIDVLSLASAPSSPVSVETVIWAKNPAAIVPQITIITPAPLPDISNITTEFVPSPMSALRTTNVHSGATSTVPQSPKRRRAEESGKADNPEPLKLQSPSKRSKSTNDENHTTLPPAQNSSIVFSDMPAAWLARKKRAVEIGREFLAHNMQSSQCKNCRNRHFMPQRLPPAWIARKQGALKMCQFANKNATRSDPQGEKVPDPSTTATSPPQRVTVTVSSEATAPAWMRRKTPSVKVDVTVQSQQPDAN